MTELKQHPLSGHFPAMSGGAFAELRADIATNGLRLPIVLYLGQVLDGWNRYQACSQIGVEPHYEEFVGTEAEAMQYVVSANLMRRHLYEGERAIIAARFATMQRGRPSDKETPASIIENPLSVAQAAELFNVGETIVKEARAILTSGDDELIASVSEGRRSVKDAAKQVRASRPKPVPQSKSKPRADVTPKTINEWAELSGDEQELYCSHRDPKASLNKQESGEDDNLIDWARWTWNPITGCLHNCPYCYARDIAERFAGTNAYPNGFEPTFRADRLSAPLNGKPRVSDDERDGRIFTGSMTDVFGRWVPAEWIEATLQIMREATQWEFLMLTKFPKRMAEFDIPANAWAGTSVDCQARVAAAESAFADIGGKYHWLSCEPLIEPLRFNHLDRFDLIVIGGASRSSQTPQWIPPFSWLDDLMRQADEVGCAVFLKSNLYRKEKPKEPGYRFEPRAPAVFHYLGGTDQRAA